MARVLVAMSGGVDSSVAAAALVDAGHEVVGATMKLWGGPSDTGCCSVADVDDARRVAQQLGVAHHVFNFTDDFDRDVVAPYVMAHGRGATPNPCVECNRHLKFGRFLRRARQLGFDAVATGHHARVTRGAGGFELRRGVDRAKDQSYVLHMLGRDELARLLLPIGELTKAEVRERAATMRLRTATKPDSQDVCFISGGSGGRRAFLADRLPLRPATVVDAASGAPVGSVPAVELVTIGQRRGLGALRTGGEARYVVDVDVAAAVVTVGDAGALLVTAIAVEDWSWTGGAPPAAGSSVLVQTSAHAAPFAATFASDGTVVPDVGQRRVAPGQSVVLYDVSDPDRVLGGGTAT